MIFLIGEHCCSLPLPTLYFHLLYIFVRPTSETTVKVLIVLSHIEYHTNGELTELTEQQRKILLDLKLFPGFVGSINETDSDLDTANIERFRVRLNCDNYYGYFR